MTQNIPQIKLAKRAEQAVQARRAPTAKQAKRAEQAAKAINLEELSKTRIKQNGTTTFLSNYNDPTELNSFIDALTNREAVSKKFGNTWGTISTLSGTVSTLAWIGAAVAAAAAPFTGGASLAVAAPLAKVGAVAAAPAIPAALDVLYEKGLKPVAAGKPQEAGLNLLMNIGETMDFAANPVKGFILEGPEGFTKATGLAEGGRVNYDYDTGNFITDMLLELISDPMNWLDFGTGQAFKSGLKTVGKNTAVKNGVDGLVSAVNKKFASSVGEITIEGSARISDAITKTTTSVARDFAEATADNYTRRAKKLARQAGQYWEGLQETERANLRKLAKEQLLREGQARTQRSIVQAIQKELPEADAQQIHLILKQANIETAASKQARTMYDLVAENITYDKLSSDIVKQMAAARHYSDTAQRFFTKGAMLTSGYGLGVEAAKNGWYGIRAWANNLTLQKLKKATVFDNLKGLDIKQWKTAKGIWEATYKYTTDLQGNVSQRDMNSFYTFAAQQFNRDRQLLSLIMQDSADPLKIAPKLEAQVKEIYGFNSFDEYVNCVKNINADENNIFANYVAYLENIRTTINSNAFAKYATGANIKTSDTLFSIKQVAADNVIARIQDAIKQSKTGIELTDKLYALKLNNAYVTAMLARDPVISEVMNKIASSEQIGALFKKLIEHPDALNPNVSALVRPTIEYVQMSGKSFVNIKEFMNNIAQLPIQKIQKINTTNFKQYIIDQILNSSPKTAAELFDNFDNTFASFKNGLETMLSDKGFKFKDYPALEDQIKGVYYQFLEKQVADNVERINIIAEDFTKSVEFLIQSFPEFNEQLLELASANDIIKTTLHRVKLLGGDLLDAVFTDKNTLFKVAKANTRRLSEVGLAIKTIDLTETHKMFDIPQEATSAVLQNISRVGASIKRINEKLMQYNVCFDAKVTNKITAAYKEVRQKMMQNTSYEKTAFSYLKEVTDPVEQFAVLAEYYKYIKASEVDEVEFKKLLTNHLPTKECLNVLDPSPLLTTDFAWDAMAESAYKAEKIFNENIINSITAYRNLGLASRKITGDFYAMREVLSTNKLDRPKLLQQERYIKFAEKYSTLLEYIERTYDSLFDKTTADNQINMLYNVMNNFPELAEKYSGTVDKLKRYWAGELHLQQDPKYLVKDGKIIDPVTKAERVAVDEITPFWNEVKQMNYDIQHVITRYNTRISQMRTEAYTLFKDTNAKTTAEFKEHSKQLFAEHLAALRDNNNITKKEYQAQLNKLYKEQYNNVYIPERDKELAKAKQDFLDNRKYLWDETKAKFNEVINKEEVDMRQAVTGMHFKNPERQALYEEFTQTRRAIFKPVKDTEFIDIELDDVLRDFEDNLDEPEILLSDHITELRAAYLEHEMKHGVKDKEALYNALLESFKDATADDIDALNLWYQSKPITKYIKQPIRNENGVITDWVITGEKTKKQMLEEIAEGMFLAPLYEELSDLYRATLNTKYQELFAPIAERLFSEYIAKRQRIRKELYETLIKNDKKYNEFKNAYYSTFKKQIDENYAIFQTNQTEAHKQLFETFAKPRYDKAFEEYNTAIQNLRYAEHYTSVALWDPVRDQQEFRKLIRRATDENAKHAFYNLFNLTPEEFVTELAYRKRFITFEEDDIADAQLKAMYNKFNKDAKRKLISAKDAPVKVYASDNGVYSIHDTVNHRYWFVLGKDRNVAMSGRQVYLDSNPVMRLQKPKQFNELAAADRFLKDPNNPGLAKTLNEFDNDFEKLTGARLGDSQGEYLAQEHLEKIYLQMPKEVQDLLPPLQEWSDKQFFEGYLFNESILGSMRSKQHLGMYSSDLLINMGHAITHAQAYIKPRSEYVNAAFDSMLSISSPNSIWNNFTDQELMEGLILNPDYKLVVLVDDKKYGMKTREILPTSVEAIQKARKLGAVIMPTQTYKDMYNVVNHRLGSTGFAKIWSRIMYAFKSGYLLRPGAMIRNTIDTQLKSRLAMGDEYAEYSKRAKGILADVKGLKDNIRTIQKARYEQALAEYGPLAQKLFDDKDRIEKYIQRRAKDGFIREDAIKAWFEGGNAKYLTYDMYKELNSSFLNEGIAGNIMTDLYQSTNPGLWETYTQLTGNIVDMGNKIESYDRLAMYLYELDHGADYSSALAKIAKTHFDYSFKTKAEQLAEMVFPFTTFALRNYSYWIEMLEKHPWIMRNYAHIMATHWDFSDYTPEELARDRRVQSQIMYGQLKLGEYNDKVITFKANPSIQSAIQMFSDPINAVYENLAAPFAETVKAVQGQRTNINNVLPLIGPAIQSAQTMAKTGSPAPSVIGVSPKPRRTGKAIKFSNSNLSGVNKYTDNTYRTPKYRNNAVYDSYKTKGVTRYRLNMYPVVDIAHEIKMRYSINVYNRIKNRIRTDVYNDVRNRIRTDTNRFR